jgi:undecaprenyl-diphosphatase
MIPAFGSSHSLVERIDFMEWLKAIVLGVVQGITEFLPISSDGHLLITQNLFDWLTGVRSSGEENLFFDVILHLGTTAAILAYYRRSIAAGLRGLLGAEDVPGGFRRPEVVRVGLLAAIATTPLIPLALFFMKWIKRSFEGITVAGAGFLVTATVLMLTAWLGRRGGTKGPDRTTWIDALLIGIAQMFAPLPGVSRSGMTIAAGLALGLSPTWAVGFSLLIAVPAILGAAVKEIKDIDPAALTTDYVAQAVAATIVAGLVGYAAIAWLVRVVRAGRIWYFSVYLILVGLLVLSVAIRGGSADAGRSSALDGSVRVGHP